MRSTRVGFSNADAAPSDCGKRCSSRLVPAGQTHFSSRVMSHTEQLRVARERTMQPYSRHLSFAPVGRGVPFSHVVRRDAPARPAHVAPRGEERLAPGAGGLAIAPVRMRVFRITYSISSFYLRPRKEARRCIARRAPGICSALSDAHNHLTYTQASRHV